MTEPRYHVTVLSIGDAGLTERPAVIDREATTGRVVKVYRRTERHLADALAARLNRGESVRKPYGLKRDRGRMGWWTEDGALFLERGAPMSGGGMSWQVWVRVPEDELVMEGLYVGLKAQGHATDPVRRFRPFDGSEVQRFVTAAAWYAHLADAGALAEARETGEKILASRALTPTVKCD